MMTNILNLKGEVRLEIKLFVRQDGKDPQGLSNP